MIFGGWARKYQELGLQVIPCRGKAAFTPGWQKFSHEKLSESQLNNWEASFAPLNIGVVFGPASGVVGLDLDRDDLLEKFPRSPVTRRGSKGEVRFFKWRDGLVSRTYQNAKVEILGIGRFAVLPPSVHPDGPTYVWLSEDWDNLPEFPQEIYKIAESLNVGSENHEPLQPGRNNKLKSIATAMFARGEAFDSVVSELLKEDAEHLPPLFTDPKEPGSNKDPGIAATRFAASILTSVGPKLGVTLHMPIKERLEIVTQKLVETRPKAVWSPEIPETGLLRFAYDYQVDIANDDCGPIFLGGAIAFVSALCGNKFTFMGAAPNVYVLNIALSAAGKGWPYKLLENFLAPTGLLGGDSYKSASALVKGFDTIPWRTRIDPLDEVGGMLKNMKGGTSFQGEMIDSFCRLWSASTGFYNGIKYSSADKSIGACWNPYHVVLASTTPVNLEENHVKIWSDKGFLPRFLIFRGGDEFGFKNRGTGEAMKPLILEGVERLTNMQENLIDPRTQNIKGPRTVATSGAGLKYAPIDLKPTPEALEFILKLERDTRINKIRASKDLVGGTAPAFIGRHVEQVLKLACIHAVSLDLDLTREVTLDSVKWAHKLVQEQWIHGLELLESIHSEGFWGKATQDISRLIQEKQQVSKSEILRRFSPRGWLAETIDKVLQTLCQQEVITEISDPDRRGKRGKSAQVFIWGDGAELTTPPGIEPELAKG